MHHINFDYHPIEFLAASLAQHRTTGDEFVVLTVRPDPSQFRPHNLGITKSQAERLLQDLQRLLAATPLMLMLLAGTGCSSTRVDVATERSAGDPTTVEKFHTTVAVDLLTDQEETPQPSSPAEEPSAPTGTKGSEVEIAGIANFATVVHGDIHLHEHHHNHIHLENRPAKRRPAPIRIEEIPEPIRVEASRPKVDPECERLRRQYEKRVREWKAMMSR